MTVYIMYPNKNTYEGEVFYNKQLKKFVITGKGKLDMYNKGIFSGWF